MSRMLAFDFGASSGRAMLAKYVDGRIEMKEIHRFTNDPVIVRGTMYWDILRLMYEIKKGITAAVIDGGFDYIGIDTWGVDFGLIDQDGQIMSNPVHYRDKRTDDYLNFQLPKEEVYDITGLQNMQINTLHQLDSIVKSRLDTLKQAKKMLFIPDLLNYLLTGEMKAEYTIASTSQLLNAKDRNWDLSLIRKAGIPEHLLCEICAPGTICGVLDEEIQQELSAPPAKVVCIASHDTASAVASVPTHEKDFIYISCGTWSLIGTEVDEPIITKKAFDHNFTNEGGVEGKIRFLKNIMGTWLIQESRRQWIREGKEFGFGELESMAKECEEVGAYIDVDNPNFIKPGNIPMKVREYCENTGQKVPQSPGEIIRCIDESLALKFAYAIKCIEDCTGKEYKTINIVGGGAQSALLCRMTANATGKTVIAGPFEATVLGNIGIQLMAGGELSNVQEIREAVIKSSELKEFAPQDTQKWAEAYEKFIKIVN